MAESSISRVTPQARPSFRGGDPAGFPGYRPLNPWGRPMPKVERKAPPARYQVFVEVADPLFGKRLMAVGPKASDDFVKPLCAEIEQAIARGIEKDWKNPHIVRLL